VQHDKTSLAVSRGFYQFFFGFFCFPNHFGIVFLNFTFYALGFALAF
jgi:hypothetical protein